MRKKNLLIISAIAAIFILGSVLLLPANKDVSTAINITNQPANESAPSGGDKPQIVTVPQAFTAADKILMDRNKAAEFDAWQHARGYDKDLNGNSQASEYDNYSDATLNILMEQNDIFAIQTLAKRQREKEIDGKLDYIKTKALYYRAAVAGSTHALTELQMIDNELSDIYRDSSPALAYKYSLNAQTWGEVRNMRGDTFSSSISQSLHRLEFGATEMDEIHEQAKIIYADLMSQRQAHGLSDFDNSPSEWEAATLAKMNSQAR